MPLVQVDQNFLLHLLHLSARSNDAYKAATLTGQRRWMMPPAGTWSGDPLDVAGMDGAFDRDRLNELYAEALGDPSKGGTVGDCAAAKLQIDYTAVMERAFRTRHMTYRRAVAHAQGRRKAQGAATGVFVGSVLPYVQNVIEAAGDAAG